jgi:tetratricopeptide (TPR) repeat protein
MSGTHCRALLGLAILWMLFAPLLNSQAQAPAGTATPEPVVVKLILLPTNDQLTIFVASTRWVNLQGLKLRVIQPFREDILHEWFTELIEDGPAQPNACFIFQKDGTRPPLPYMCPQEFTFKKWVAPSDVFWYNPVTEKLQAIEVLNSDVRVSICNPSAVLCEVQYVAPEKPRLPIRTRSIRVKLSLSESCELAPADYWTQVIGSNEEHYKGIVQEIQFGRATFSEETAQAALARDQLDLVISGECQGGTFALHAAARAQRDEVAEAPDTRVESPLADLKRALEFTRAMIAYAHGDYTQTTGAFSRLRSTGTEAEFAQFTFLRGNSLLLSGDYEGAVSAYDLALRSDFRPGLAAYNNRLVAQVNAILVKDTGQAPLAPPAVCATLAQPGASDLFQAAPAPLKALTYFNLAEAVYLLRDECLKAEPKPRSQSQFCTDAEQALAAQVGWSRTHALVVMCQPIAFYYSAYTRPANVDAAQLQHALDTLSQEVRDREPALPAVYLWRGALELLKSDSPRQAAPYFECYRRLARQRRVKLESDLNREIALIPPPERLFDLSELPCREVLASP